MTPSFEQIRYEVEENVLTITLDRPERLNAWTATMQEELLRAFDEADDDDAVRAIIVTGAGRGFCSGADLVVGDAARTYRSGEGGRIPRDPGGILALRVFESTKPVIAAVNGPAVGFGATFVLPMDIRLASEEAFFSFVFPRLGAVPEAASTWFLPRVAGLGKALEWTLTGRRLGAAEALDAGLLNAVHPADALLDAAREIGREIATRTAPVSVALTRRMLWTTLGLPHPMDGHRAESKALVLRSAGADLPEGTAAFVEKRDPQFTEKVSDGLPDLFPELRPPAYE